MLNLAIATQQTLSLGCRLVGLAMTLSAFLPFSDTQAQSPAASVTSADSSSKDKKPFDLGKELEQLGRIYKNDKNDIPQEL